MDWRKIGMNVLKDVVRTQLRKSSPSTRTASKKQVSGKHLAYSPKLDGAADPGEIVWTWVAYEEDASRGKDRPVLVVGRDGDVLLGLMLSSNADREGERGWLGLGAGTWDAENRSSWVRLDRVLAVPEHGIRREGAVLDRTRFELVADHLRRDHRWH